MTQEESQEQDPLQVRIVTDSDPQIFEGFGEEIEVHFHIQDEYILALDLPKLFVVETVEHNHRYNVFREITEGVDSPLQLIHHKSKKISAQNLYLPDAIRNTKRIKRLTAAAAAAGLAILVVRRYRR